MYVFRGQAMVLTARKGRLFGNTSFCFLEMWKELLFRLNIALANNSLFCFFLSSSLSFLVALAVISFLLVCWPPCWTEVQTSPHYSHSRHCLSFRPIHPVLAEPRSTFLNFVYSCLTWIKETWRLAHCLLSRACLLTSMFLDRWSLLARTTCSNAIALDTTLIYTAIWLDLRWSELVGEFFFPWARSQLVRS